MLSVEQCITAYEGDDPAVSFELQALTNQVAGTAKTPDIAVTFVSGPMLISFGQLVEKWCCHVRRSSTILLPL
jgi:hypothetical protein